MTEAQIAELESLLAKASEGPFEICGTDQLYVASLAGPHNIISNDILAWDAGAYVALRNAAPALLKAARRFAALERHAEAMAKVSKAAELRLDEKGKMGDPLLSAHLLAARVAYEHFKETGE
jgi:hypothetical protein